MPGIRYPHPGQRLVGRRRADRFRHQVQRAQSRQGSSVLQLCRGRSGPHQRQVQLLAFPLGCQLRHQDGGAHQLHEDARPPSRSVYLINQDYSFGQSVRTHRQGDARRQAAGHPDRRRRAASAAEDHRLRALYRQDQGIGRRQRHHRQLGPGFRAAAEGCGRRRTEGRTGTPITPAAPAARPPSSRPTSTIRFSRSPKASPTSTTSRRRNSKRRSAPKYDFSLFYPRAVNQMRMFAAAADKAKSLDPVKVAAGARRHGVRGLQRRQGLHAQGRSPVLPADVHRLVRRAAPTRSRSTRKRPAGAGSSSPRSTPRRPCCRPPARWTGRTDRRLHATRHLRFAAGLLARATARGLISRRRVRRA